MTREEAIQRIKANMDAMYYFPETIEAFNMAIEALQEPKTIIAIDPPYKNDKGLTMVFKGKDDKLILEEVKEIVAVVRCGDCRHLTADGRCLEFADDFLRPSVNDYCSYGERKENVD